MERLLLERIPFQTNDHINVRRLPRDRHRKQVRVDNEEEILYVYSTETDLRTVMTDLTEKDDHLVYVFYQSVVYQQPSR